MQEQQLKKLLFSFVLYRFYCYKNKARREEEQKEKEFRRVEKQRNKGNTVWKRKYRNRKLLPSASLTRIENE